MGSGPIAASASIGLSENRITAVKRIVITSQAKSMKLTEMNSEMLSVSEPMREIRSPVRFLLK